MSASATDYIGMWYRARARLGIDDRIEFIFIHPASGKRHTVALRHRDHDGVGGIAESLKRMGVRQPPMPLSRRSDASRNHPPGGSSPPRPKSRRMRPWWNG